MTTELYLTDSYQMTCPSEIIFISPDRKTVALNQTIIYPGGGGQPRDIASLWIDAAEYSIEDITRDQDYSYLYHLAEALPENVQEVTIKIDAAYRLKNMRYHTLLHLTSGYFYKHYGALATSNQIEEDHARLEIKFPEETVPEKLEKEFLQAELEKLIQADYPVTIEHTTREKLTENHDLVRTYVNLVPEFITDIRLVKIADVDVQTCAGTHITSIKEVGQISVEQLKNKGRLKKRIKVTLI